MRKSVIAVAIVAGIAAAFSVGVHSAANVKDLPPTQRYTAEAVTAVATVPLAVFVGAGSAWYEMNRPDAPSIVAKH